jgi:hypothetical protein
VRRSGGCAAKVRAAARLAALAAACLAHAPGPAAGEDVLGEDALVAWRPAAGEVSVYVVFVSRDGGPFRSEQYTGVPRARVFGRSGETVQVRVQAYGLVGGRVVASAPSEASEPIRFLVPEAPIPSAVSAAPPEPPTPERVDGLDPPSHFEEDEELPPYPPLPEGVEPPP